MSDKIFNIFLALSLALHFVILTSVFDKPLKEPKSPEIKKIIIKLGVNNGNNSSYDKLVQRELSIAKTTMNQAKKQAEMLQQQEAKLEQEQSKESDIKSAAVKIEKDKGQLKIKKTTKDKTELASTQETPAPKEQIKENKKAQKPQEFIKIVQKASNDITQEVDEETQEIAALGHELGASIDKHAKYNPDYEEVLGLWIRQFQKYPQIAKKNNITGTGYIFIKIDRSGKILLSRVLQTAGHPALDNEMRRIITNLHSFKLVPTPNHYRPNERTFSYKYPVIFE